MLTPLPRRALLVSIPNKNFFGQSFSLYVANIRRIGAATRAHPSFGSAVRGDMDGWTDGRTLPSALSPCFAVDKKLQGKGGGGKF